MTRIAISIIKLALIIMISFSYFFLYKPLANDIFYSLIETYDYAYYPGKIYSFKYYIRKDILSDEIKYSFKDAKEIYYEGMHRYNGSFYNNSYYDIVSLDFTLSKPIKKDQQILILELDRKKYELNLGKVIITTRLNNSFPFKKLALKYDYLFNNLLPVGLNLELNSDLLVTALDLSENIKGNLNGLQEKEGLYLLRANKTYYIPFDYLSLELLEKPNIKILTPTNEFYLDYSLGLISFKRLSDFPSFIAKGVLVDD